MSKIQLLDPSLINKIAAGEVVERPASVVKELIENCLDAKSTEIVIDIENGGLDLIQITDNGVGMSPEDAKMSLQRHATSKIETVSDLDKIMTLGFRGEALAAISSVSKFRMVTKPEGEVAAFELSFIDEEITEKPASGVTGTMIEIKGLFHTVPARKKFMKTGSTEFRHILSVVTNQALLTPNVSWKLSHNKKEILNVKAVADWKQRIIDLLGKERTDQMIELNHQRGSLIISGFLFHPAHARPNLKEQYLFVNKRPVSDYLLFKAIKEGYHNHIPYGAKPGYVIQVSVAPDLVDVNVHPRKSEVKFAEPSTVYREMLVSVRQALSTIADQATSGSDALFSSSKPTTSYKLQSSGSRPPSPFPNPSSPANKRASFELQQNMLRPRSSGGSGPTISRKQEFQNFSAPVVEQSNILSDKGWMLIGQAHDSYLIVQTEDAILFVDQHAVAEKILFDELMKHLAEPKVQGLLVPTLIELSNEQKALVAEHQDVLTSMGIEGELFGGNSYQLTGIPQNVKTKDMKAFILGILDDMADEDLAKAPSLQKRQEELAKMASCRGAIKFGDHLAYEEQVKLLNDLIEMNITACCHGRPVLFRIDRDKLDREFCRP
jgi:DNA mismatch repair protein MutL